MPTAPTLDQTHDAAARSWVEAANAPDADFPIQNLPYAVYHKKDEDEIDGRVGVAIGDEILDLAVIAEAGLFKAIDDEHEPWIDDLDCPTLSFLLHAEPAKRRALRHRLFELLSASNKELQGNKQLREHAMVKISDAVLHAPGEIGDYTDFYASVHHATNVGSMFRPDNPLLPNYKWIPIGYHGRASSIVPSGTPVRRPLGQTRPDPEQPPTFGPSKLLDYELEVGCLLGPANSLGEPMTIDKAEDAIFGICLVNDWSARDLQKWEYQPLGPFLAKSFATTLSPWVVTTDALAPFRCPAFERPEGDPQPLPHLDSEANRIHGGIDLSLEALITTKKMRDQNLPPHRLSTAAFKHMYWTFAQMVTHHGSNGCNLQPGDLLASGTVSGPNPDQRGCLLELTWGGPGSTERKPVELPTGETRTFLQDGDEVILRGWCEREGQRRIGLGECRGIVQPAPTT